MDGMTFKCNNCGHVFDEDSLVKCYDDDGCSYSGCPYCKDYEIEEVEYCEVCGKYKADYDEENEMCEECVDNIVNKFKKIIKNSMQEYELTTLENYYAENDFIL